MSDNRQNEIRGGLKSHLLGRLGGRLIWALGHSLDIRVSNQSGLEFLDAAPVIFVVWHDQIIGATSLMQNAFSGRRNVVLTSASRDGGVLAGAVSVFGMEAARGSSSRRGAAALVALRRALRDGADITITPDGPRGPRRQLQNGVIQLASLTGAAVVPVCVSYENAWSLKSWDKLQIPKPGSRMTIRLEKALEVPPSLDEAAAQEWANRLQAALPPA